MLRGLSWRNFDFWLLGAIVLATAFGVAMIRSAVAGNEVLLPLIQRQIYFAFLGLVVIFLVASIDYRYWLARYFENSRNQPRDLRWVIYGFLWAFGLVIWILLQPNLSNVVVIMVIFVA